MRRHQPFVVCDGRCHGGREQAGSGPLRSAPNPGLRVRGALNFDRRRPLTGGSGGADQDQSVIARRGRDRFRRSGGRRSASYVPTRVPALSR
jgi:hypothetical protein